MADTVPIGVPVGDLRPTQMTLGLREVDHKRQLWRDASAKQRTKLLREHVLPAVIGPKDRPYIVDHHHFARALVEEDAGPVAIYVLADLSHLPKRNFWTYLDNRAWCHAYDERGRRRNLSEIPHRLVQLSDDPFRSLAAALIRAGGCAKSGQPFSEFLWADYLRHRIDPELVLNDFDAAVRKGLKAAQHEHARSLPGWCAKYENGL